jgi:hypothetical protein
VEYNLTKAEAMFLSCRTSELTASPLPLEKVEMGNFDITIASGGIKPMDAFLPTPILVELVGAGFDIPWGKEYILRWPRLVKIYEDREWIDGVTIEELRDAANKAIAMGNDQEMEQWNLALGVVDRYHAANGTVVPSSRAGDKAREEQFRRRDEERYGVEMMYGLNIEAVLEMGAVSSDTKRKVFEIPETPQKRACLSVKSSMGFNRSPATTVKTSGPHGDKRLDHDIEEIFSTARVVSITNSHRAEITSVLPWTVHLDVSELDANKENALSTCQHIPQDQVVLVDGRNGEMVRKILGLVKQASLIGGKWYVCNWKIVWCINGNNNLDWRNEILYTYVDGNVYRLK